MNTALQRTVRSTIKQSSKTINVIPAVKVALYEIQQCRGQLKENYWLALYRGEDGSK